MDLEERVRRTVRRRALAGPATRVLAAVSGGPDSVALVHLLRALDTSGDLHLTALAHFNHQLRAESDADQQFCAELALSLGLPFFVEEADVAALARRDHRSIEDAARTARHAFLERARGATEADAVAVGHTRDDQAETFLLRLLRGAGARGLAAMHPRNGPIIRPLLECRRDELKAHLAARGARFVEDASNADVGIPRNRVRAELLPLLADRFNPSVVDALADAAEVAQEEWAWLNASVDEVERHASHRDSPQRTRIDTVALTGMPAAVARVLLQRSMTAMAGGRSVGFAAVERALELSRSGGHGRFDAPGQRVQRIGPDVVLTARPPGTVGRLWPVDPSIGPFRYPLRIPGTVNLTESGYVISAEEKGSASDARVSGSPGTAVVRRDLCGGSLAVRNRRPGDRFRSAGLDGRKKLQDFFVDRKVDRRLRDQVPLVVDEADRIVWVAGHAVNDEFRVTDPAQAVIILRLKGVGGAV